MRLLLLLFFITSTWLSVLALNIACAASPPATLSIEIVEPLRDHEGPPGKSRILLSRDKEQEPIFDKKMKGIWDNLGYCRRQNAYLLGGMFAHGGFLPVRKLALLSVDSQKLTTLEFGEGYWSALAGILSPDGEYWVFVGEEVNDRGEEIARFGLFCLSLEDNKIVRLGAAPAAVPENPPPKVDGGDNESYWGWGSYCCDCYFKPDRRVMYFSKPHILSVDYGYDPRKKRQHKKIVDFDLPKLIAEVNKKSTASRPES